MKLATSTYTLNSIEKKKFLQDKQVHKNMLQNRGAISKAKAKTHEGQLFVCSAPDKVRENFLLER